jgi:glycosyltransferase involved in cell wall biosynthesis
MSAPAVTVFTTFHEPDDYLYETIASVLAQTFTDFELLLVCDGDPARCREVLERVPDPRLRLVHEDFTGRTIGKQLRMMLCRNRGFAEAHAALMALLDADDLAEPERLATQVAFMRKHPECVLVGSAITIIDEHSRPVGVRRYAGCDAEIRRAMLAFNCIAQSAVMLRRDVAVAAGEYGPEVNFAEDYDLWLRMLTRGRFHNLAQPLTRYRIHSQQGKALITRFQLRDTLRVKWKAMRRYGLRPSPRAVVVSLLQLPLLLLPPRFVYWLFRRVMLHV